MIIHHRSTSAAIVLLLAMALFSLSACDSGSDVTDSKLSGPPGRLFVLNQSDATMYVFDTETMVKIDSADTKIAFPHNIEFSPDGSSYYIVTLQSTGMLAKYNSATLELLDSVTVAPAMQPTAIAITPDGRYGYICNFSSPDARTMIQKYDLTTLTPVSSALAGAVTHDLKITSDGKVVVACNRYTNDVTLVYTDADTVVNVSIDPQAAHSFTKAYGPFGVAIDHRDSLAFIACMDALQVRVLDIAKKTIVDSIDIPCDTTGFIYGPTLLAVAPDNDVIYLTTRGGNTVVVFRLSTKTILAEIPVGAPYPFGITMSSDGSRVYVACVNTPEKQGRIYVIDGANYTVIDSVDVGTQSFGLVWRPIN